MRTLAREGSRPLRWDLAYMELGDALLVPKELMPFRKVYEYVKQRQYALDKLFVIERDPRGTVVRRTDDENAVSGRQSMPRPGPPGKPVDWGILEKQGKQWRWPLANMELGDIFWVWPEELSIDKVRARCANVSTQLNSSRTGERWHFNVEEAKPQGMIRVQRVTEPGVAWDCVKYAVVRARVANNYETRDKKLAPEWEFGNWRVNLDMTDWWRLREGQDIFTPAELLDDMPERTSYVFEGITTEGHFGRFALDMEEKGFRVTRIAFNVTQQQWDEQKLEVDPFS